MHCGVRSSIPGLYPGDASSTPKIGQTKCPDNVPIPRGTLLRKGHQAALGTVSRRADACSRSELRKSPRAEPSLGVVITKAPPWLTRDHRFPPNTTHPHRYLPLCNREALSENAHQPFTIKGEPLAPVMRRPTLQSNILNITKTRGFTHSYTAHLSHIPKGLSIFTLSFPCALVGYSPATPFCDSRPRNHQTALPSSLKTFLSQPPVPMSVLIGHVQIPNLIFFLGIYY